MYDELIFRLRRYSKNCIANKLDADFADAVQQAADAIEKDVREIKHGRWSFDNIIFTDADGVSRSGMRGYKCSECDGFCIGESNFCPNCGADMRGE